MSLSPLDQIMDTAEAAELWGLNQDYIKQLCQKGKLIAKRFKAGWILLKDQPNPAQK